MEESTTAIIICSTNLAEQGFPGVSSTERVGVFPKLAIFQSIQGGVNFRHREGTAPHPCCRINSAGISRMNGPQSFSFNETERTKYSCLSWSKFKTVFLEATITLVYTGWHQYDYWLPQGDKGGGRVNFQWWAFTWKNPIPPHIYCPLFLKGLLLLSRSVLCFDCRGNRKCCRK